MIERLGEHRGKIKKIQIVAGKIRFLTEVIIK